MLRLSGLSPAPSSSSPASRRSFSDSGSSGALSPSLRIFRHTEFSVSVRKRLPAIDTLTTIYRTTSYVSLSRSKTLRHSTLTATVENAFLNSFRVSALYMESYAGH